MQKTPLSKTRIYRKKFSRTLAKENHVYINKAYIIIPIDKYRSVVSVRIEISKPLKNFEVISELCHVIFETVNKSYSIHQKDKKILFFIIGVIR